MLSSCLPLVVSGRLPGLMWSMRALVVKGNATEALSGQLPRQRGCVQTPLPERDYQTVSIVPNRSGGGEQERGQELGGILKLHTPPAVYTHSTPPP